MCDPDCGVLQVLCGVSGTIWGGCRSPCMGLSPWAPPGLSLSILMHLQPPSALPTTLAARGLCSRGDGG